MRFIYTVSFMLLSGVLLRGQTVFENWLKPKEGRKIEPFMMVQLWGNYTFDQEVYDEELGAYTTAEDRWNVLLRRARLGFRAEPYPNLKFTLVGAYDLVGRDLLSGLSGGSNNGSLPEFGIWDAFFQWRIKAESEAIHLTGGYFRPQFGRESITSGWSVNSMEKSMSQNYIRKHLVGTGPGRAVGLNLGGLLWEEGANFGFNYNIGVFNPVNLAFGGNSGGLASSPLVVARGVFNFGDPEMKRYKIGYDINYYNQRRGLSLGVAGAWQGATDLFDASYALETDVLFNWGPLNVDGEWIWMQRGSNALTESFTQGSQTGHIRVGYNLIVANRFFLEPVAMIMAFDGAMDAKAQEQAALLGASYGEEHTYDVGVNWYLDQKRLKLMLHYTWRGGDAGALGDASRPNSFFRQGGVGAIRRGNWLGLGVHAIF